MRSTPRSGTPSSVWKLVEGKEEGTVSSGEIKQRENIEWEGAAQRTPWTRRHGGRGWEVEMLILFDMGKTKRN